MLTCTPFYNALSDSSHHWPILQMSTFSPMSKLETLSLARCEARRTWLSQQLQGRHTGSTHRDLLCSHRQTLLFNSH